MTSPDTRPAAAPPRSRPSAVRFVRAVLLAYAVAWPALHLLLWLPVAVEMPLRAGATEGATAALLALTAVVLLGALGALAVLWPLRLWGARDRAARRRAAAWCAGLVVAYAALFLPAWIAGPGGRPPHRTWPGEALGGLSVTLNAAATIVGLPLSWLTDDAGTGAALYVASALGAAALSLARATQRGGRRDAPGASG